MNSETHGSKKVTTGSMAAKRLSRHMTDVDQYRSDLAELAGRWDLLTIIGQISGTGTEMGSTRRAFAELTDELLGRLGEETVKKAVQGLRAKAQVAVDILIRNLFERTADIGFLATDADIRTFILEHREKGSAESERALRARFREYVAKYSVYHDIVLLDTEGVLLARMDDEDTLKRTDDPLIAEALNTSSEYVEIFRKTELVPGEREALVYAYRVTESDRAGSPSIGVLCLCFRFEDELEGIFANLVDEDDWSVLTILDAKGAVIASSDPYQVPVGSRVERVLDEESRVIRFAGREYLATTRPTKGYQGFMGLGWQGHVMLPLEHAFEEREDKPKAAFEERIMEAVMRDPRLFSDELRSIPVKAKSIQEELDLTVWNGNVGQTTHASRVLLQSISDTGAKTKQVFENSIGNLHQTVVSSILEDVAFQAALAVDIMDRNLYERANDCRWWALTSDFRTLLEKPEHTEEDREIIRGILKTINGLYTVYTNLFVYDLKGKIIAVSNDAERKWEGVQLGEEWVSETLGLTDSQAYSVSEFKPTDLYTGRSTYIYGAVITSLSSSDSHPVGGIGIVFDSEPQFFNMLQDSMPQTEGGDVKSGYIGVFADRKGVVVSSTSEDLPVGSRLPVARDLLNCPNGQGTSGLLEWNNQYYAVGACTSGGYREYKVKDAYKNDIIALVFAHLADVDNSARTGAASSFVAPKLESGYVGDDSVELATFRVGQRTFAFLSEEVKGAVLTSGLTPIPGGHSLLAGKIAYENKAVPVIDFPALVGIEEKAVSDVEPKAVIIQTPKGAIGLLVDDLGAIPSVKKSTVDFNATLLDEADLYTAGVVMPADCSDHRQMVVILDPKRLQMYLSNQGTFRTMKAAPKVDRPVED